MSSLNGAMGYIVVPSLVEGFKLGSGYIATYNFSKPFYSLSFVLSRLYIILSLKPSANWACATLLIDRLGY